MMGERGSTTETYARAVTLALVAGLRSQLPLAILAAAANRGTFAVHAGGPLGLLRSRVTLVVSGLAAGGELIGDKLPMTPSRLAPPALAGRLCFGAMAGAAIVRNADRSILPGLLLGAAGAGVGSAVGYTARAFLDRATGLPDPIWGAVEDLAAIGLAIAALGH